MNKGKTRQFRRGAIACMCAIALAACGVTAYAASGGGLFAQSGTYAVNFSVGPYDKGDVLSDDEGEYYASTLTPDATSKMGVSGGSMSSQTVTYGDSSSKLDAIGDSFWVVGYSFSEWALVYDYEGETIAIPANITADSYTVGTLDGPAAELGDVVDLAGIWEPYELYSVMFMSSDGGNGVVATRGIEDAWLEWNSEIAAPSEAEMRAALAVDTESPIAFMYADDASSDDIAERANIKWYTAPGGPTGGGLLWSGGKFYTTVTSGSMTDAEAIAADKAVRANSNTVRLYPYYNADEVAIEYYGNGSDGDDGNALASPSDSVKVGQSATVKAPVNLTKNSGKSVFVGWSLSSTTTPDDTDNIYKAGDTIAINASTSNPLKLYAVWEDTYTVAYDPNGGTLESGSLADKTVTSTGETGLLPTATLSRVGYDASGTDTGWYVKGVDGNPTGSAVTAANTFNTLYNRYHATDGTVTLMYVYAPKSYTVVYDWNGGYAKGTTTAATAYEKTDQSWDDAISALPAAELANVERPGWTLDYWTLSDGTTALGSDTYGTLAAAAGNTTGDTAAKYTVKAHWAPQSAVVNYIPHEPTGASDTISGTIAQVTTDKNGDSLLAGGTVTLPSSGYSLTGWTLSSWSLGTVDSEGNVTLTTNVGNAGTDWTVVSDVNNLYTVWTANKYSVSVYGNGSTSAATQTFSDVVYDASEGLSLTEPTTAPTGYSFGGWATVENVHDTGDASFVAPDADSKYRNLSSVAGATVNLYPVWVPDSITVTLSNTDPSTNTTSTTDIANPADSTSATLSAPAAVDGYVFKGWYESAAGTGDLYGKQAGTSKTNASLAYDGTMDGTAVAGCVTTWPTEAKTLYAVWTEIEGYTVTYVNSTSHKNGDGKPSLTESRSKDNDGAGTTIKWTSTGIVPTDMSVGDVAADGYTFKGWFKQGDLNADGTLKSGVSESDAVPTSVAYKGIATKLGLGDSTSAAAVLYAGWEAGQADVVFANGAFTAAGQARAPKTDAGDTSVTVATTVGTAPTMACNFSLDGYEFKYWKYDDGASVKYFDDSGAEVDVNGNAVSGGATYKAGATGSAGNTLTAQWEPISYNVKFEDGAGNVSSTVLTVKYDEFAGVTLPAGSLFTKAGYSFKTWKNTATNDEMEANAPLTDNLRTTAGDVVFQAQWGAQVTFEFIEGEGTLEPSATMPRTQTLDAGGTWEKADVPEVPAALKRAGYVSDGWTDGAGNYYKVASSGTYDVPSATSPQTITLFPKWVALPAKVILHLNTGEANGLIDKDVNNDTLVTGATAQLPNSSGFSVPGFTFLGWSVADDGTIDPTVGDVPATVTTYTVPAGDAVNNESHLYAVFQANGIVVKFESSFATGSMSDQTDLVAAAQTGKLNANAFTRDGYTFAGWVRANNAVDKLDANRCLIEGQAVDYVDGQQFSSTTPVPVPGSADNNVVTLMAAWQANEYAITFEANGADNAANFTGDAKLQKAKTTDSPVVLNGPAYTRAGYTFEGWSASSSRTDYVAGSDWKDNDSTTKYTVDTSGSAGANTLYAIWKPSGSVAYTIERYLEDLDGTNWTQVTTAVSGEKLGAQNDGTTGATVSIAGDSATLYEGFTLDSTVTGTKLSDTVAADGTTVLKAYYKRNVHSITYELSPAGQATPSGWSVPAAVTGVKYGATGNSVAAAPTATGWTFSDDGWTATLSDSTTLKSGDSFTMPDEDIVLTGAWTQDTFAVTFAIADEPTSYDGATGLGSIFNNPTDMKVASGQKMSASQKADVEGITVQPPAKSAENGKSYYQTGWKKKVGASGTWTACGDPWNEVITDVTVFAPVFKATYAVVYKPGDGGDFSDDAHEGLPPTAKLPAFAGTTEQISSVDTPKAKAGYVFAGWKVTDVDVEGGTTPLLSEGTTYTLAEMAAITSDSNKMVDGNYTLVAQWTRDASAKHTLALDFDGGKVSADATVVGKDADAPAQDVTVAADDADFESATVGEGVAVTMPLVEKDGCTFTGWEVVSAPNNAFAAPVGALAVFDMPAGDVSLKAVWIVDGATIDYRSADPSRGSVSVTQQVVNKSTGAVINETRTSGNANVLGSAAVANHGYKFGEWIRVDKVAVPSADVADGVLTPSKDTGVYTTRTYEAVFEKDTFSVNFAAVALADSIPTGCRLDTTGLTDEDLAVEYLGSIPSGKVLATADSNGAYKFSGWLYETDADGNGTYEKANGLTSLLADPGELSIEGNTRFWPAFVPAKVNVTYNLNDPAVANVAENSTHVEKAETDSEYTVKGVADVLTAIPGYVFKGWSTEVNATAADSGLDADTIASNNAKVTVGSEGLTLYAVWEAAAVDIVYEPGLHAAASAQNYTDSANKAGATAVAVKTLADTGIEAASGYAFAGWLGSDGVTYLDPEGAPAKFSIDKLPGAGLTMTAQWKLAASDIVYIANGGIMPGSDSTQMRIPSAASLDVIVWTKYTVEHGREGEQPFFVRDGYTFSTWNEKADGTGTAHAPGSRYTMPASGGLELYAQWVGNAASITLSAGDSGVFAGDLATVTYSGVTGDEVTVTAPAPTVDGVVFKGWSRTENATEPDSDLADSGSDVTVTLGTLGADGYEAATELYAVWTQSSPEPGPVDKTALEKAIAAAKAAEQGVATSTDGSDVDPADQWTTAEAKQALDEAIAKAQAVADNEAATQDEVDAAKDAVEAAQATYDAAKKPGTKSNVPDADKTALRNAISSARATEGGVAVSADGSDVDPADKWTTPAEKKALTDAIAAAQAVANDQDATQEQVNDAAGKLNAAVDAYNAAKKAGKKTSPQPASVDKAPLQQAIARANGVDIVATSNDGSDIDPSAKWTTPAEKKALTDAIAAAQAVAGDPNATQAQVNDAVGKLNAAIDAYNAAKKDGTKGSGGNGGDNPGGNGNGGGDNPGGNGGNGGDNPGEPERTQIMYRLYNPNSGEHFYTADADERDNVNAAGWNYEGIGWVAPVESSTPVYRAYSGTDHHYTTDWSEIETIVAAGWTYEGIGWYSDDALRVPLYRQFNPNVEPTAPTNNSGSHNYTVNIDENNLLVSVGWLAEGIGWYAVSES